MQFSMVHDNEGAFTKVTIEGDHVCEDSRVTTTSVVIIEEAPEKKVTTFAITMSILDMMAIVIVLGVQKFYLVLQKIDLGALIKSITVLTLILQGIRILCRSRGLELDYMHNMKQLPLSIRIISGLFYWLHLISVLTSVVLSTVGLASHGFSKTELVFFYVVAILEAMVFLIAMAVWIWKVSYSRLFKKVQDECRLGTLDLDMDSIRRFFYDAYYKCVTGNIFDVPKMDLVTFAEELLVSTSSEEQIMGARILEALSTHEGLSDATLGKILTSKDSKVIERMIKILIWKNSFKEEVRCSAAKIVSKLAEKEPNMKQHVAGMKEAMESVKDMKK